MQRLPAYLAGLAVVLALAQTAAAQSLEPVLGASEETWHLGLRFHPPDEWGWSEQDVATSGFHEKHLSFYADVVIIRDYEGPRGTDYSDILGPDGFPGDDLTGTYDVFLLGFVVGIELWTAKPVPMSQVDGFRPSLGLVLGTSHQEWEYWNEFYDPSHILDPSGYYKCKRGSDKALGFEYGVALAISPFVFRYTEDSELGSRYSLGFVVWGPPAN
ncbi:MAG: hypothetical protein FJ279_24335 [Planctomycetes bacterium]|nr:hypothetical protein [Planctomycetota bacterium]